MPPTAKPDGSPLSAAELRQIEAEELALAQVREAKTAEAQRLLAAQAYRQEVREALKPRPMWWRWRGLLGLVPLLVLGAAYLWPKPAALTDNAWGGISDSALMERCRAEVSAQTAQEPDLRFPAPREAAGQLTANADGKRWDGWAARPDGSHLDFSCSYAAADGEVTAQLMPN